MDYRYFEEEFEDDYDPSDIERDSDEWGCAFGHDCVNPHFIHLRSECYTAEMAESWQEES